MRVIRLSSKLRPGAYCSVTEIVFTQEMQPVDLELHLELAESLIKPLFSCLRLFQMAGIHYFTSN